MYLSDNLKDAVDLRSSYTVLTYAVVSQLGAPSAPWRGRNLQCWCKKPPLLFLKDTHINIQYILRLEVQGCSNSRSLWPKRHPVTSRRTTQKIEEQTKHANCQTQACTYSFPAAHSKRNPIFYSHKPRCLHLLNSTNAPLLLALSLLVSQVNEVGKKHKTC